VHETLIKRNYVAPQQLCDILHKINPLKENTMFDFEKQYKDAMQQAEKTAQQITEFWYSVVKDFFNTIKTK
jgi:hypothetical protein